MIRPARAFALMKVLVLILSLALLLSTYPLLRVELGAGSQTAQFLLPDGGPALSLNEAGEIAHPPLLAPVLDQSGPRGVCLPVFRVGRRGGSAVISAVGTTGSVTLPRPPPA